jgi:hypothetical protein
MGRHGIALTPADTAVLEQQDQAEYLRIRTRCLELGLSKLTFNQVVTDLTLHGIDCWANRLTAAKKILIVCKEVSDTGG